MMQKSALRTTLLLAFLSMAPVAVPAPPNNNSTEEAACQLLVANMNAEDALGEALKTQEANYRQHNPNARHNPESVMGLQQVVRTYWPTIFDLYQQCFGKLDTSSPDNLYTTFLAQSLKTGQVALDEKITIEDLQKGLQRTEQYLNNDKDPTLNYNCSTDYLKQMLAVANALREKNEELFQQQINEILAEYSRQGTTDCLAGLNARLFQPIVGGIQAYLRTVLVYYLKVVTLKDQILKANPTMRLSSDEHLITESDEGATTGDTQNAENEFFMNCVEIQTLDLQDKWRYLQKQYNKIFGPFKQNETRKQSAYQKFEKDIVHVEQFTSPKETGRKSSRQKSEKDYQYFLKQMIKINNDLELKVPDSFSKALAEYENTTQNPSTANKPYDLSISLSLNALRCMKHQLSKTFGGNPEALLKKITTKEKPKNTPLTPPQTSSFSHQPVPTPQTYTPASLPQNAPPGTPQTGPLPHTPPKTKTRTIFLAPDGQSPSAFFQPPTKRQGKAKLFHREPATVPPLYAQSPNNTPQTSSMRTQMPTPTPPPFMPQTPTYSPYTLNTLPPVSRLDSVDGVNVTTPQIGSFPHQPVPTQQAYAPISWGQNTSPAASSQGPFANTLKRAADSYRQLKKNSSL
ncbi:MAG: hypothetical protein V6Z78_02670 [Holosporaceae bacterium]